MNRLLMAVLLAFASLFASGAMAEDGLVASYSFDEGTDAVLKDSSGQNNHGKIERAKWVRAGDGYALEFDGVGSFVDCGEPASLDIRGPITLMGWVRPASQQQSTEAGIIGQQFSSYVITCYGINAYWYVNKGDNSIYAGLQPDSWQHVAATFDGKMMRLYVNGVEVSERESKWPTINKGGRFCIGAMVGDPSQGGSPDQIVGAFKGAIDEVKVYNRALSADEISSIVAARATTFGIWSASGGVLGQRRAASISSSSRPNLAAAKNGCWAVTSSHADLSTFYSDNLIDDDPNTLWRSYQKTREEYAELKWDFEMMVDRVEVFQHELGRASRMMLYARQGDRWMKVAERVLGGKEYTQPILFNFMMVRTRAFRLVMSNDAERYSGLYEIRAFGPEQPLLRLDPGGKAYPESKWSYVPAVVGKAGGDQETVVVEEATVTPPNPSPRGVVTLTVTLKPTAGLSDDYAFVVTVGEREMLFSRADYSVARVILAPALKPSKWPAGRTQTVKAQIYIPEFAPHGNLDVMLHGVSPAGRPPLRLVDARSSEIPDGKIARVDIRRFKSDPQPDRKTHMAKIDESNATVISIDGKMIAPIMFAIQSTSFDRYHYYTHSAGVKLYHLQIWPFLIDVGDYQPRNFAFIADHVRNLVRIDPNAYVIIQMYSTTSQAWQDANPDECLYTYDGRRMRESFCSQKFREEQKNFYGNLVKFVQSQPWGNRVIGYLVELGQPEGVLSGYPDIGDYNPQAIEAFREYERKKYGNSLEQLRKAFGDPELTFEKIYPDHEKIQAAGADGGCFLDPIGQRLVIDYHEFLSTLVPTALMECAEVIKQGTGGRALVGSYWAYLLEDISHGQFSHQANHNYTPTVLKSPDLDFFASPFNYWRPSRHAGDPYLPFQPYDALRVNGKLHIPECDNRTFRAGAKIGYREYSREESVAIIRRNIGTALMHGMGAWFADWANNYAPNRRDSEPYFVDDQLLQEISKFRKVYQETIDLPRGKTQAEVAVFASGPSCYYHDNGSRPIYTDIIQETLYFNAKMMGVPIDELIFEDIMKPKVQKGYKLYIFVNAFYMTPEQRRVVESLKRDGNTLLWIYAPDYVSDTDLSVQRIREITGFKVDAENVQQSLSYKISGPGHAITSGVEDLSYGGKNGAVSPRFIVGDDSEGSILGRYPDGKGALAVKDFGTYRSIYSAVPYFPTSMLRNIARYAGCHVYTEEDIYMDATRDFLMLTNSFERERNVSVRLPDKRDIIDLDTGKPIVGKTDHVTIKLPPGKTALYRLK